MGIIKWMVGVAGVMSLATFAGATTCPTDTWCFGSNPATVSDGATYSTAAGSGVAGTITVFSEQVTDNNNDFFASTDSTVHGLFSTDDNVYDEGVGIAPYDPREGGSPFSNQQGLTNMADGSNDLGNILVLELGSNIAEGTTLQFLLQAGIGASGDVVSDYWQDGGNQNVSPSLMHLNGTSTAGEISTNGTTPQSQLTLTKNTAGVEFVAIEADCHYILLDTITGTPPTAATPEPRFYALLLAGLLVVAGMLYQKRRAASASA